MLRTRPLNCLVVGNAEHAELRPAMEWLAQHSTVTRVANPDSLLGDDHTALLDGIPFDLIVLAQARPGEFSAIQVEVLHRAWPLARLVGLLGSWCEGEERSGRPWPGVWRVPAISFSARLQAWVSAETRRRTATWHLPRLATPTEQLVAEGTTPAGNRSRPMGGLVLIAAPLGDMYEPLGDAVRLLGYSAAWQRPRLPCTAKGISVAVWDALRGDNAEWHDLAAFAHALRSTPIVVIMGFPRADDLARVEQLSVAIAGVPDKIVVLPKPFRLEELDIQLSRLTVAPGTESHSADRWMAKKSA